MSILTDFCTQFFEYSERLVSEFLKRVRQMARAIKSGRFTDINCLLMSPRLLLPYGTAGGI